MTDEQREMIAKFTARTEGEHLAIEREELDGGIITRIPCRGDRDPEQRLVGLLGLSDDQLSALLRLGLEGVRVLIGPSDGRYVERYPLGFVIALRREDRDRFAAVSRYTAILKLRG